MASQFQATRSDQTGFNPKEFLFKYLRFLPLFLLSLVLSLIVAFFYLRYTAPAFQSKGSLILTEDKRGASSNDKFDQLFVDDRSKNINNEIEYLKSKALMTRVVEDLGINTTYYAKGKIKQLNVYKDAPFRFAVVKPTDSLASFELDIHFRDAASFSIGTDKQVYRIGEVFSRPEGSFRIDADPNLLGKSNYSVRWSPASRAALAIRSGLTVINKAGSSGILIITVESDNARMSADIVNQMMKEYQESTIQDKNTKTRQTLDFLNGRLAIVNRELDSITNVINNYKKANNLGDIEAQTSSFYSNADLTDDKLTEARLELNKLDIIDQYLKDTRNAYELVPSSLGITDQTLNTLIAAYNTRQIERKTLVHNDNTPVGNPRVQLVQDQIEKLRLDIIETMGNVRKSYNAAYSQLIAKSSRLQNELRNLPAKEQLLRELERAQHSKEELFKFLNEKKEETAISLAATISNTRVLEKAETNRVPVRPTSGKVRGIALLIGLMIPLIFVLVLEILDDKITSRNDIERKTDATVLGEIGHAPDGDTLVVKPRSRSFIAEQFRIVRSNLQYVLTDTKAPVLLVTSSFSGEGKSFVSTNMGAVMALAGKRTVILEFDVRKPKILSGLNMTKKPGLTNFMLGKASVEELLVPVEGIDNLWVLPCGPIPPNPAELLLEKKLEDLFAYLRSNYDFIVMDTAPVGMVGDAMSLAHFVDITLYIVRQGVTHKKQLEMVNDFYKSGKLPKMSIILNDVKLQAGYGYYGYGRYGYGYGSGSYGYGYGYGYYDDDVEGTSFLRRWFGWAMPNKKKKPKKEKAG
ncbi:MAG: polysaccharide biosynthesis tyrosine autokinase [Chitinophagaceae bacterium]|nr:MAG: polysaccharide biosynthesis tyrosine autokinase [Chitinophagaceae bacterium]